MSIRIVSLREYYTRLRGRTLSGVLEDGDDSLELFRGQITSTLGEVDIGLLANQVGVSAADTLDLGHSVHDLLLAINVCVQQTDDILETVTSQFPVNLLCSAFRKISDRFPAIYACNPRSIVKYGSRLLINPVQVTKPVCSVARDNPGICSRAHLD